MLQSPTVQRVPPKTIGLLPASASRRPFPEALDLVLTRLQIPTKASLPLCLSLQRGIIEKLETFPHAQWEKSTEEPCLPGSHAWHLPGRCQSCFIVDSCLELPGQHTPTSLPLWLFPISYTGIPLVLFIGSLEFHCGVVPSVIERVLRATRVLPAICYITEARPCPGTWGP